MSIPNININVLGATEEQESKVVFLIENETRHISG